MRIVFAGDLCFRHCTEVGDPAVLFGGLDEVLAQADFRMLNLECPLSDKEYEPIPKSGPPIQCAAGYIDHLDYMHIDLAGMANNHIGDYGSGPIGDTVALLQEHGIAGIGAGETVEKAYEAHIFEKDGLRVSVLAVCENEFGVATATTAGSAGLNLKRLYDRITEEKSKADFAVVFFHGGNETNPFPSSGKTELYRLLIDMGADALIATHTHCPQGTEVYKGKPIIYSMGNFYFPRKAYTARGEQDSWYYGYTVLMDFDKSGITYTLQPYRFGNVGEPLVLLRDEEKERFFRYLDALTAPITDPDEVERLFNIWSATYGEGYEFSINYKPDMKRNAAAEIAGFKNLFGCDAHNEMMKRFTALCYENRFDEFRRQIGEIEQYQTLDKFM